MRRRNIVSKDIALSTGRLPPVASPMKPHSVVTATKFGAPAATSPAIEDRPKVILDAGLRPTKSAVIGQNEEPSTRPTYFPTVRTLETRAR